MISKRIVYLLIFLAAVGTLITLAVLNIEPLSSPFQLDMANRRLQWIERSHEATPAYLSIPAGFFTYYMINLGLAYLFTGRVSGMNDRLPRSLKSWLQLGLLGLAAAVAGLVLMICAIVGLATFPYSIVIAGVLLAASTFGGLPVLLRMGRALLTGLKVKNANPQLEILAGTVIVFALISIPLLGILSMIAFSSLGLGLAVTTRFGAGRPWSVNPLSREEIE